MHGSSINRLLRGLFLVVLPALVVSAWAGDEPDAPKAVPLANAAFTEWKDGRPSGWEVSVGATTNGTEKSRIRPLEGGGVALSGEATTGSWKFLSQRFPIPAGSALRLHFTARGRDLRRDPGQFDSCYVGLWFLDGAGNRLGSKVSDVVSGDWTEGELLVAPPEAAVSGEVAIFLSKSGTLEVRDVRLDAVPFGASFGILADEMARHYSFFEMKKIDWPSLTAEYRKRAGAAKDPAAFVAVIREMLGKLEDPHVWVQPPGGPVLPTFSEPTEPNYDFRAVAGKLASCRQVGPIALLGRTKEGYGYAAIGSLQGPDASFAEIEKGIEGMLDAPGFLLDLRANGGGNEQRAQRIASIFADRERIYGRSKVRSGPEPGDFEEGPARKIAPRDGPTYTKPVVCLIGPRCMSSGEGFVMMMRVLPHVTLFGLPTRGASGNPAPVDLPNGVRVFFSRWVSLLPDGTPFEGKGIPPDIEFHPDGPGDPTFDAAVAELTRRVKKL